MINENKSDLAMILMSSMLFMLYPATTSYQKQQFYFTNFQIIEHFLVILKRRKIYLKWTGIRTYGGKLSLLSKIPEAQG